MIKKKKKNWKGIQIEPFKDAVSDFYSFIYFGMPRIKCLNYLTDVTEIGVLRNHMSLAL